jgi:hypothetical protein
MGAALFIVGLSLFIPMLLLLAYWERSPLNLPIIFALANRLSKFGEIILIVLPLASLYIGTSVLFVIESIFRGMAIREPIAYLFIASPIAILLFQQPLLYTFLLTNKANPLPTADLIGAGICVTTTVFCLFVLEFICRVARAYAEVPIPWRSVSGTSSVPA